jgi:hypothetical protein
MAIARHAHRQEGVHPTARSYKLAMRRLIMMGRKEEAQQLWREAKAKGLRDDPSLVTERIFMLKKVRRPGATHRTEGASGYG